MSSLPITEIDQLPVKRHRGRPAKLSVPKQLLHHTLPHDSIKQHGEAWRKRVLLPRKAIMQQRPLARTQKEQQCQNPDCHLSHCVIESHWSGEVISGASHASVRVAIASTVQMQTSRSRASSALAPAADLSTERWTLPFNTRNSAEFQNLLKFFTLHVFRHSMVVMHPLLPVDKLMQLTVRGIQTKEMMATTSLAVAQYNMISFQGHRHRDSVTDEIYLRLVQALKVRVAEFKNEEVDDIVLGISALTHLDILLQKYDMLAKHRKALKDLVSARGGLNKLGRSLVHVLEVDRELAMITDTLPIFQNSQSSHEESSTKLSKHLGTGFDSLLARDMITKEVHGYCQDAAYLLELFDNSKLMYDIRSPIESSTLDVDLVRAFLKHREELDGRFPQLYHIYTVYSSRRNQIDWNWLAVTSVRIFTYFTAHGNVTSEITRYLCGRLAERLTELTPRLDSCKSNDSLEDSFIFWMLWIANTAASQPIGSAAFSKLRHKFQERLCTIYSLRELNTTISDQPHRTTIARQVELGNCSDWLWLRKHQGLKIAVDAVFWKASNIQSNE